jgi:type IV secretory pathway VirB4 component
MQKRPFFFQHTLGFRRNPFGALERDEWTAVSILPVTLPNLLTVHSTHVQLLGAMGSGKTTTMLKLADELAQTDERLVYEYLPEGQRRYTTDTAVLTTFCLDEAQRLTRRERRRLVTAAARQNEPGLRLIFSSHEDLTRLFRRWQRPLTTVNLEETLTVDLYSQMLAHRLDYFALPDKLHTTLSNDAVQWLYDQFYPNMRDAEYFLYEVWQRETAVRELTAKHLQKVMQVAGGK